VTRVQAVNWSVTFLLLSVYCLLQLHACEFDGREHWSVHRHRSVRRANITCSWARGFTACIGAATGAASVMSHKLQ
jgi:hypothetical protein